jgi:hypothetical protein
MSEIEGLLEIARQLKSARSLAEACSDTLLLYLIDMAILAACEGLAAAPAEASERAPGLKLAGISR